MSFQIPGGYVICCRCVKKGLLFCNKIWLFPSPFVTNGIVSESIEGRYTEAWNFVIAENVDVLAEYCFCFFGILIWDRSRAILWRVLVFPSSVHCKLVYISGSPKNMWTCFSLWSAVPIWRESLVPQLNWLISHSWVFQIFLLTAWVLLDVFGLVLRDFYRICLPFIVYNCVCFENWVHSETLLQLGNISNDGFEGFIVKKVACADVWWSCCL